MTPSRAALAAGAVVLASVALAAGTAETGGAAVAAGGRARETAPLFLAALVVAFLAYLAGLALLQRGPARLVAVATVAAAIQLAPLAGPLLLSTDAWTYWGYARIAAEEGGNPYADRPSEFPASPALPWTGERWRDTTSVYGPLFTVASEPVARLAGDDERVAALAFRLPAALAALAAAALAARLVPRRALAFALVGWNPLLAVHLAGGGHNDIWVGLLAVGALLLAARRRTAAAGVLWSGAAAVKWVPVVFLALAVLAARGRRLALLAGAAAAAAALGLLAVWRYDWSWLEALRPLAEHAALETSYSLPHRVEQLGAPDAAATALAAAALAAGLVLLGRRALAGRPHQARAALLVLLTTPWLAVWYLAWALPLAAAEEDTTARVGCLALCAYLLPQAIPL